MVKEKKAGKTDKDLLAVIKELADRLSSVEARLVELFPKSATEQIEEAIGEYGPSQKLPLPDETVQKRELHSEYRQIIDQVLGKQFEAWETYDETPATHFKLYVLVPMEISSISAEERSRGINTDIRTAPISYAEGANGVRIWCMKIRQNLARYYANQGIRSPFTNAI